MSVPWAARVFLYWIPTDGIAVVPQVRSSLDALRGAWGGHRSLARRPPTVREQDQGER